MRALLFIVSVGLWGSSLAQDGVMPGGYLGVGLANFDYEENIDDVVTFDDSASAYKIYGGYRFNETWAFEAAYEETDTVEESLSVTIPGIGTATGTIGVDVDAITLRGLGHFGPFFVGAGYFDADANLFAEYTDPTGSYRLEDSASDDGLTAILGLQWDLSAVSLRVEYEWWDIDEADASQIGVGVHYRFE